MSTFFRAVFLASLILLAAPTARAEIGASCAYPPPNGSQPGIMVLNGSGQEVCALDSASCNPAIETCLIQGCNPVEQTCVQEPPEPEVGPPAPPAGGGGGESGFVPLVPIPGLTDNESTSVINSGSLADFFNNLYKYLIGLAAAAAIIQIIRGGLEIAFTGDNVSKLIDSKARVSRAIQGLILIFLPYLVFSIINPSILNLEINLQPLDTIPADTPSGDAGDGNVGYDQTCSDDRQCQTRYCSPETNRCANQPNEEGHQCLDDASPGSSLACPEGRTCTTNIDTNEKYCALDPSVCTQRNYDIPVEFSEDCPKTAPYENFCPTGGPDFNECKMTPPSAETRLVICVNMNIENGCLIHEAISERDLLRNYR